MLSTIFKRSVAGLLAISCFATIFAGGFQLWEQDGSGIGDYHAGAAAEADTAGTEYYNPAGMIRLQHMEISAGLAYIPLYVNYTGVGSGVTPDPTFTNLFNPTAAQSGVSSTNNFVPNFHFVYPVLPYLSLGFGVTVPFGLSTSYSDSSSVALAATKTDLKTVNINPSIAFALSKYFSLGLGFDAMYGEATYNSMAMENGVIGPLHALKNKLTDWTYGWNAGAMIYVNPHLRAGVSYRSDMLLKGRGTSTYNGDIDRNLMGNIHLPATTILSLYSDINTKWAVMFSAYYTQWQTFDNLILRNVLVVGQPTTITVHENYNNTWNFAVGVHYWILHNLQLKAGLGHDQTPTQTGDRDIRLPDASRWALAIGLHWVTCPSVAVDGGWIHFFIGKTRVDNSQSGSFSALTQTVGHATSNVNVVGFQISFKPGLIRRHK